MRIKTKSGIQIKYADSHRIQAVFEKRNRKITDIARKAIMDIIKHA